MDAFLPLFMHVVVPLFAGLVFFAMAIYVRQIGPMRTLITGELTYQGAFWGFLFLGIYLASRPVQILFPHPWPLIINSLREFGLIGVFGPAVFLAMMSLVFGAENIPRSAVKAVSVAGIVLALVFITANVFAIGGSAPIFKVGAWEAHDGLWFRNPDLGQRGLMRILFVVRVIDPILLLFAAGTAVLWHGFRYPPEKKVLYDNMPRKLIILGLACYAFSFSMFAVGVLFLASHIANQWWIYYVGSLTAGILETVSLSLPMKKHVSVSEHL
jgi:hypothetical protein